MTLKVDLSTAVIVKDVPSSAIYPFSTMYISTFGSAGLKVIAIAFPSGITSITSAVVSTCPYISRDGGRCTCTKCPPKRT